MLLKHGRAVKNVPPSLLTGPIILIQAKHWLPAGVDACRTGQCHCHYVSMAPTCLEKKKNT